jgi:hypothetical protein
LRVRAIALEQVLFVKQFWESYPEHQADLTMLIHNGQFTFASPNVSQPDSNVEHNANLY